MTFDQLVLPKQIQDLVEKQKQELLEIKGAYQKYCQDDDSFSEVFDLFIQHRIDDHLHFINNFFNKHAKFHHFTPKEIDIILHNLLKEFIRISCLWKEVNEPKVEKSNYLIINWLKQNLLTGIKTKEPKHKDLSELCHFYINSNEFEKELIFDKIRNILLRF